MALRLYGDGNIENVTSINTAVSSTELGYLDGVTSGVQSQINNGGLVFLGSDTVVSNNNANLSNIFSTLYENYLVLLNIDNWSVSNGVYIRMKNGVSAESGSVYYYRGYTNNSSSATEADMMSSGGIAQFQVLSGGPDQDCYIIINISKPAHASRVGIISEATSWNTSNSEIRVTRSKGIVNSTTSYDGIQTFIGSGATVDMTMRVYAYTN